MKQFCLIISLIITFVIFSPLHANQKEYTLAYGKVEGFIDSKDRGIGIAFLKKV